MPAVTAYPVELTVAMPCLDEARTLEGCIEEARRFLQRTGCVGEILVADNGSSDGSVEIALRAGARVIRVNERGYGAALRAAIDAAHGRYVVMGDSDGSYDFNRLELFLRELRRGSHLVVGDRFAGGIEPGAMPFLHRHLGNPVLSAIGRLLFASEVKDFHCGLRAVRKEAALTLNLRCPGMEFATEMIVEAARRSLDVAQVPTRLRPDGRDRPPHLRTWRDGWRHLMFMLRRSLEPTTKDRAGTREATARIGWTEVERALTPRPVSARAPARASSGMVDA